jgi:hypothetical protein
MPPEALVDRPTPPPTPSLVLELERCFEQVKAAGVPAAIRVEFHARRNHDKDVRTIFEALPRVDERLEFATFIWMKHNSFTAVATSQIAAAIIYIDRFREKIFFSERAIPRLELLSASDDRALIQFCTVMNSCPDLDSDMVYRAVGRQYKIYLSYETTPLAQLLQEFNERCLMGNFEVFFLDEGRAGGLKGGGVGFLRRQKARELRAEGRLDLMAFRRLQARLHFEDRPEILHILAQSSAYAPILAGFARAYIDGYEDEDTEFARRLSVMVVSRK